MNCETRAHWSCQASSVIIHLLSYFVLEPERGCDSYFLNPTKFFSTTFVLLCVSSPDRKVVTYEQRSVSDSGSKICFNKYIQQFYSEVKPVSAEKSKVCC